MSGRLFVAPAAEAPDPHIRAVFHLDGGRQLRFRDAASSGVSTWLTSWKRSRRPLGPEPLAADFTLESFRRLLDRRSGRLKSMLLDQEFLAGVGNIYADEILFTARLNPSARLIPSPLPTRCACMKRSAPCCSAPSLRAEQPYRIATTWMPRAGPVITGRGVRPGWRALPGCGALIQRLVVGGRSTHFCPQCQQ